MVLRRSAFLSLSVILSLVSASALAGDAGHDREQRYNRDFDSHRDTRDIKRNHDSGVTSPDGLPSVIPGLGTFSGGISAVRITGSGNYFVISGWAGRTDVILAPKARIIDVRSSDNACSYEAGVCVVRP